MFHPYALQWRRVRLGPLPKKELASMYKVTLRWVDAIFIEHDTVYLVEAKLRNDMGAISQLKEYKRLFPQTPEFSAFKNYPVRCILLIPYPWPDLVKAAEEENIEVVVYKPKWFSFE